MRGGIEETSASFEARSAPRSYPTGRGDRLNALTLRRCRWIARTMAESSTITTLRTKRDQIEGLIAHLEDRIKEARTDLAHVNATLRLFEMDGGACCPRTRSLPLLQRQPAAHCSREHASSKD